MFRAKYSIRETRFVSGTKVTFHSDQVSQTVVADDNGFYQADIPVGLYTMTAQAQGYLYRGFGPFRRPLFRLSPGRNIVLDVHLHVARNNCDIISWEVRRANS